MYTWVRTPYEGYDNISYCSRTAPHVKPLWSSAKFHFFSIIILVIIKPGVRQGPKHCNWKDRAGTECRRKHLLVSRVAISHNLSVLCELVMQPLYWSTTSGQRLFTFLFIHHCMWWKNMFWCSMFTLYRLNRKIYICWHTASDTGFKEWSNGALNRNDVKSELQATAWKY